MFGLVGAAPCMLSEQITEIFSKLPDQLRTLTSRNVDEHWNQAKWAAYMSAGFACGSTSYVHRRQSLSLMEGKLQLWDRKNTSEILRYPEYPVTNNRRKNHRNRLVKVTEEAVEVASDNTQKLLKLVRQTGRWRTSVGETVCVGNGEHIRGKQ